MGICGIVRSQGVEIVVATADGAVGQRDKPGHLVMNGREVFRHAVNRLAEAVEEALTANGLTRRDIDWLVPHQANQRIIDAMGRKLGLTHDRVVVTVDRHATDIAGRHGIGFKIAIPSEQGGGFDELILDPKTFRLMGQQLTLGQAAGAKAGQIVGGVAILKTALVSGPGILP